MKTAVDTVAARARLKPRRDPYWQRIAEGCYVGFRLMSKDYPGAWSARSRDPENGKQRFQSFGSLEDVSPSQRFDAAVKLAREWFEHLGKGGSTDVVTVRGACERYLNHLERTKGAVQAADALGRFKRYVYPHPLAKTELRAGPGFLNKLQSG